LTYNSQFSARLGRKGFKIKGGRRTLNQRVAGSSPAAPTHLINEADQDHRDRMAIAAAPYLHPRLAVIDSTVQAKVEVSQLTPEQRRERARAAIAEAFAERSPPVIAGEYRVVGGREVPVAHKQAKSEPPEERDG